MGTKNALRQRALRLVNQGVTQKAIAAAMGMSPAAFSRWMHDETVRISLDALDGFNKFVQELAAALGDQETQRVEAPPTSAGGLQRTGTDLGPGPKGQ